MNRRGFLKQMLATTAIAAVPLPVLANRSPIFVNAAADWAVAGALWEKRLAIEVIEGTYFHRFMGASDQPLIQVKDDACSR